MRDKENLRQLAPEHNVTWPRFKSHSGKKMRRPARAHNVPRYRVTKSRSGKKMRRLSSLE